MKVYDVNASRKRLGALSERRNESLGRYDRSSLGIGRYVAGTSPWERHSNGDELFWVTGGELEIEVLGEDGSSERFTIGDGSLFVVPSGRWHQLTAHAPVTVLYASPAEDGAERTREHPFG